jgi:hypothetical protein
VTVELLSIAAVLVGGCALMRTAGLRGWALVPMGFLAGLCLEIAIGFAQVVLLLPTSPALTLALTAGLPVAWWTVRCRQGVSLPWAALAVAGVGGAVLVLRAANLVRWHTDSVFYLMPGWLIADGSYRSDVSIDILTKRLLGVPLLHAPANLDGAELYLRSVTPLLAVATVAALWWYLRPSGRAGLLLGALGVLVLVTNNRYVFNAFYLNGHLLFAALLLLIVASGWRLARADDGLASALMTLQIIAIPALVVTRAEGFLAAALALLPTWLSARVPRRHRVATMLVLGVSCIAWHVFVLAIYLARGAGPSTQAIGGAVLGALVLAAIPFAGRSFLLDRAQRVLWLVEAGLWLALAAFAVERPGVLIDSVRATYFNAVRGYGRWGYSLVILGLLVLGVLLFMPFRDRVFLRFGLTTFAPLAFLLAYLREGAYRIGVADSLSRMLIEYVPLAVLFVLAALTAAPPRAHPSVDRGH